MKLKNQGITVEEMRRMREDLMRISPVSTGQDGEEEDEEEEEEEEEKRKRKKRRRKK